MLIDPHTVQDLEILRGPSGGMGVLDKLDRTHTRGGREAFRRRLTRPLSSAREIRDVQSTLRYIRHNRGVFQDLPRDVDLAALRHYLSSRYVTVTSTAGPALTVEGWWIRLRYSDLYNHARNGVSLVNNVLAQVESVRSRLIEAPACMRDLLLESEGILTCPELRLVRRARRRLEPPSEVLLRDYTAREQARSRLDRLIDIISEIDALVSMSDATQEFGFTYPVIEETGLAVEFRGLYHPFLKQPIANDLAITYESPLVFLTGPNMAGKTTYLKAAGIGILLAHCGMGVPALAARLAVFGQLSTAIRTEDNLAEGVSYFQAEARRVHHMATSLAAGRRCIFLVDELFRGTNVKDAYDASRAVLQTFARASNGMFVVASHLVELLRT